MDSLNIYIDRLKDDEVEILDERIDANYFDIREKELKLMQQVGIKGSAYLTSEYLVVNLMIEASASVPCAICNQEFTLPIVIDIFTHTVPLKEIQGAIYNLRDEIRNAILLKIPPFSECNGENCPSRKELNKYLKNKGNLPFSDLTL